MKARSFDANRAALMSWTARQGLHEVPSDRDCLSNRTVVQRVPDVLCVGYRLLNG